MTFRTSAFLLLSLILAGAAPARAQTLLAAIRGASVNLSIVDSSGGFGDMTRIDYLLPAFNDGLEPSALAIDHFDQDGYLDLVIGISQDRDFHLYKYPGLSGGGFGARERFAPFVSPPSDFLLADWAHGDCNGDGIADFVLTGYSTAGTIVMLSSPSGYQLSTRNLGSTPGGGIALADVNADGHLDMVRARRADGQVALYLGDGTGGFAYLRDLGNAGNLVVSVVVADFDNDYNLDVIAHSTVSGDFTLWRGDGAGNFQPGEVTVSRANLTGPLVVFDYNRDGKVDLVSALGVSFSYANVLRFHPGRGNGTFGPAVPIPIPNSSGSYEALAAPPLRHPRAPVARATPAEQTLAPGDTAHFDGSASTAAPGSVLASQTWVLGDGSEVEGAVLDHTYTAKGRYWPELRVVADNGLTDAAKVLAVVTGAPPVADAGGPYVATPAQTRNGMWAVPLDGRATVNDGGETARYRWNLMPDISFSDEFAGTLDTARWTGTGSATEAGTLRLTPAGYNPAILTSRETFPRRIGLTYITRMRITSSSTCGGSITFGFKGSSPDPHTFSHALSISIHDPYCVMPDYPLSLSVTESGKGNYARTLDYGFWYEFKIELHAYGASYWMRHSGTGEPWELLLTSTSHFNPDPDVKVGMASDPGIVNEFDFVRVGREAEGPVLTENFGLGTFPVTLTVTDFLGQSDTASTTVTTSAGRPPTVVIHGPVEFERGLEARFRASASTESPGIFRYEWSFGGGIAPTFGDQIGHVFPLGDYVVRVTVYDHTGQTATATHPIRISSSKVVRCVPWRLENGIPLPQETWSGKEITLKGVANTALYPLTYTWNFGDGSPTVSGTVNTLAQTYAIEARHAYSGETGRTFLAALSIVDNMGRRYADTCAVVLKDRTLEVENNVAIDQALWYLYKSQQRLENGIDISRSQWNTVTGSNRANVTASVLQAFAMNGHKAAGDPTQDPYVETVRAGLNGLLETFWSRPIAPQPNGNPDANGNGIGIGIIPVPDANEPLHVGSAMVALIAAGGPTLTSVSGRENVPNRPFRDLVQDMADMYAFGQQDYGRGRGGWGKTWNNNQDSADNFSSLWGVYGLLLAERHWGITVPEFVKAENRIWLDATYQGGDGICGFGFNAPGHSLELTPAGMVQLAFQRTARNSTRWSCTEARMDNLWASFLEANSTYGYLAFTAAMRLAKVPVVNLAVSGRDWLEAETGGLRRTLVNRQRADGSWLGSGYLSDAVANTAWTTLILSPPRF